MKALRSTLFEWPLKQAPRLALSFFIVLAALFHFSTIYLFNITYQPSHVSKPVPAQVFFLLPHSSISQQVFSWLKSNDPSIFSPLKTVQATLLPLPSSIYEPASVSLPLRTLPTQIKNSETFLPPVDEPAFPFLQASAIAIPATAISSPTQQITIVQLQDPLSTRISGTLIAPSLPPEVTLPLSPTKLTLNIDEQGMPRHVILLQSCGNTTADEIASRWAMTARFAPADHDTWGNLLIIWGKK